VSTLKLVFLDKENMFLFLNQVKSSPLNFEEKETLEQQVKQIFLQLKEIYHISFCGYYTIYAYQDALYGCVLKIHHEDIDEFELCDEIEICFHVEKNFKMLYQVEDPMLLRKFRSDIRLYYYQKTFYLELIKEMTQSQLGELLEYVVPHFQNTKEILKYGKRINW